MQRTRLYRLISIAICFQLISCDPEEVKEEEPVQEEVVEQEEEVPDTEPTDDVAPEIVVTGITEAVETYTDISLSISDASETDTRILLDGEVLFSSTEKQFDYQLDPYPLAVGMRTLSVQATDSLGNQSVETFTLDVKHLLLSYEYSGQENDRSPFKWIFFNDMDGLPLANFRAVPGTEKIYTDQIVSDSTIFYSIVNYTFDPEYFNSKRLLITTNKITLGGNRLPIVSPPLQNRDNEFNLTVNQEESSIFTTYWGSGSEYRVATTGSGGGTETLGLIFDDTDVVYVRNSGPSGVTFIGEEAPPYSYLSFPVNPGSNQETRDEDDFVQPEGTVSVSIAAHDEGSLRFNRFGYTGDQELATNTYHNIYEAIEDSGFLTPSLALPVLNGLNYYRNQIRYQRDGKSYLSESFENLLDTNMPDWSLSSDFGNDRFTITDDTDDVDVYIIQFIKNRNLNSPDERRITWNYRVFGSSNEVESAPILQVPSEITTAIGESFFESMEGLTLNSLLGIDYTNFETFEEIMDWFAFIQNNPTITERSFRQVSFPTGSVSGKSSKRFMDKRLDAQSVLLQQ